MRKLILAPVVALALMVGSQQAMAGVFVEPYAGWNFGSSKMSGTIGAITIDESTSFNGLGVGTRLGVTLGKSFWLGADVLYSFLTDENDDKVRQLALGGVLGFVANKFRLWGGVNVINKFGPVGFNEYANGLGFKGGLGYMFAKSISLNAEYLISPVSEACDGGTCVDTPDAIDMSNNAFFVSLSFPFGFNAK